MMSFRGHGQREKQEREKRIVSSRAIATRNSRYCYGSGGGPCMEAKMLFWTYCLEMQCPGLVPRIGAFVRRTEQDPLARASYPCILLEMILSCWFRAESMLGDNRCFRDDEFSFGSDDVFGRKRLPVSDVARGSCRKGEISQVEASLIFSL